MKNLPIFSASKIQLYKDCRARYYAHYVASVPDGHKNTYALLGSALHYAIEAGYSNKNPFGALSKYIVKTVAQWEKENYYIESGLNYTQMMSIGQKILNGYDFTRWVNGVSEYKFKRLFPSRNNPICYITGYIDRLTDKGIIDFKSNFRSFTQEQVNNSIQFTLYAWLYREKYKKLPEYVICYMLREHKEIYKSLENIDEQIQNIAALIAQIKQDDFRDVRLCDMCPKYCTLKNSANRILP